MKKLIVILLTAYFSLPVQAALTVQSVAGGSYVESETDGNYTLYGGISGACLPADMNNTTTCNSCGSSSPEPCNLKSVYGGLQISVSFTSDKDLSNYKAALSTSDASSGESSEDSSSVRYLSLTAGSAATLTTTWGYLCNADANFSNSLCSTNASVVTTFSNTSRKIFLKVDQNGDGDFDDDGEKKSIDVKLEYVPPTLLNQNFCTQNTNGVTGVCGFELKPGDSKLYLQQIFADGSGAPKPYSGGLDLYGVALFVAPVDISLIGNGTVTPQIKQYDSDYYIEDNAVTGLVNYNQYCVLMGNVSKAQNIYVYNTGGTVNNSCAEPSEVVGMLADKSCFISTAAFGSEMADQVQTFRDFRNQFLLKKQWGVWFVKKYYQYSPPLATVIAESEFLRALTRGFLYPLLGFAWLATHYGMSLAFLMMLSCFGFLFGFIKYFNKGKNKYVI